MGKLTRGERNCRWIEEHCRIPEGRDVGKPVALRDWQRKELLRIYDNPHGTRRAILSFGRKNGKTAISAFIALLHLCGPEAKPNSQLYSAAQSREQASILFALAAKVVRMSPTLSPVVTVRDTAKQLFCEELGTLYRALSAEASTAYGLSPVLIIHDELGQVKGPRSELYEALETATGAQESPLSIIISTQSPTDADLLSMLIEDGLSGADPRVIVSLYTAPEDLDPFTEEAIRAANPAFGDFQNASETLAMAEDARRMPSREAEYRNLILNQRIARSTPFVSQRVWADCGGAVVDSFDGLPVFGGLDLSQVGDLTALVLVAPVDGVWHVKPTFWLPEEGLRQRAHKDRQVYDLWKSQGLLTVTPGASIDYEFVAGHIAGLLSSLDVRRIAFDRHRMEFLTPWLRKAGIPPEYFEGDDPVFSRFGQGMVSMAPALDTLEAKLLNGRVAHGRHPILEAHAIAVAVTLDDAGNRKFSKKKSNGRIDGMVALAMAMSVAETFEDSDSGPSVYAERGALMM